MTGFQILLLALVATQSTPQENESCKKMPGQAYTQEKHYEHQEKPHGTYRSITIEEARRMMRSTGYYALVDVRTPEEYHVKRITGAINIPNETIAEEPLSRLPDLKQPIFVYCEGGGRSKKASQKLADIGYENVFEMGGIDSWSGSISR